MFGLLGLIKGVAVVCSMAFALPVGGVYASADSPSKYLDRLTTVNTSVNREDGGVSSEVEDEPTVSRAVRTSHGVILNTVVRNANRLEYVDDYPEITSDDRVEPVHKTVTRSAASVNDSNEHTVNLVSTDVPVNRQAQGIEWPDGGFTGESTVTYDANGKGSFEGGATTNVITTKYNGFNEITKYAHTDNVNDAGEQFGGYGDTFDPWGGIQTDSKVVRILGAESLTVTIKYQTQDNDWVCLYPGGNDDSPAGNANCSTGTVDDSGKLGGYTMTTQSFTVDGDSVTFWFKSDGYPNSYYGYYAVVSGLIGSKDTVTGSYQEPVSMDPDYDFTGWNTKANGSGEDIGKGEVSSPSSLTVYAQWKSNWNKWGTIGWMITDDGVLRIRPWEGNTGTTGYSSAPWHDQASNIKKVESTGTIVLNANSSGLFEGCSSLTDLTALASWNVSKVTNMRRMFEGCSSLQKVGIPSIANGGQKLVKNASINGLSDSLNSRIIAEDLHLGPYTWGELNAEMTASPDTFNEGHVWVRYIPSWIVTYDGNGGVGSQTDSKIPLSKPLTLPKSQFLRFGYKFIGWTTQQGSVSSENPLMLTGTTYKPDHPVDGKNYPLYAQWEKIGGEEDQPVTGQSGSLPGWVQVGSENTRNDILPNKSQSVVFTNKYDPGITSIQFRFTKLMDGNVPDSSESFQFELFSVSENKVIQTTVNNGASVQFDPITYDKPGEYVYYVRESPSITQDNVNANPSIDYDDHLVEVKVTVTEEDDPTLPSGKKLAATAQITGDTVFRNDSKPASLDITKTVTGVTEGMNDNHKDREFTFNVNLLDRDNQPVSGKTYPTMITNNSESSESNGDDSSSTSSITFDSEGNATIGLRAGSKLTINGIPAYYKYTITETNIPAGYENTSLTNSSGVLGANSHVTVDAVNHYTATPANASLQAGKTLLAPGGLNQSVNNGEFRFSLCQVTPLPIGSESGPNAESCTGVSEASNDGNGLVTFPQLTYDAPGTYRYQIREVKGDALDMKYDSTVYTVTVKVTDDGEGRLVAAITYRNNTTGATSSPGLKPVWDPSDPGAMGVPVFVNRTTVANRLPVTGGRDIIIASVILALVLAGGLFVFLRRNREE